MSPTLPQLTVLQASDTQNPPAATEAAHTAHTLQLANDIDVATQLQDFCLLYTSDAADE